MRFSPDGVSLEKDDMVLLPDFAESLSRLRPDRLGRELLVRAEVRTGSLAEVDVEGLALDRELLLIRRGDRHRPWAVDALSQAVRDCAAELSSL